MTNYYNSKIYKLPIEVDNIWWEIILTITDDQQRKIIYSWYDIINKNTRSDYITKWILWWLIKEIPKKILIIWFWWWAYCKYIEDHFQNTQITWIDIDQTMFNIAKKEFWIKTNDLILDTNNSAIDNLIKDCKKFDLILIDTYWKSANIPDDYKKYKQYEKISKLLSEKWTITINFADYSWLNIWIYNKINHFLLKLFNQNNLLITSWENNNWNVIWIYNLDKKYETEEIIKVYLKKVKEWLILYDSNIIKNIFIKNN
jgi:spermidine synthase